MRLKEPRLKEMVEAGDVSFRVLFFKNKDVLLTISLYYLVLLLVDVT